jgi:uncharacterized protein
MRQHWGKLLFIHWPVEISELRKLIPAQLEIDTFDGQAWIGLVPFTMWGLRPPFLPPLPWLSHSHELNVRTYVHLNGVPGVWFHSLDANNLPAVIGARVSFFLPYFYARMNLVQRRSRIDYKHVRRLSSRPVAEFRASWEIGPPLPEARPGSLDFFLTERYCLYSEKNGTVYRARIYHKPWPLREASLLDLHSTMIESMGLKVANTPPLLHYAEYQKVSVWRPEKVSDPLSL